MAAAGSTPTGGPGTRACSPEPSRSDQMVFGIPSNRIVAFAGPYVSAAAGGIASWLIALVNIAGLPGLDENNLKTGLAAAFTWLLVSALTWAGHSKWLTGHHIQMESDARVSAAVVSQPVVAAPAAEAVAAEA